MCCHCQCEIGISIRKYDTCYCYYFSRSGTSKIAYEDLVAYGEETGGLAGIRDAADALAIVDIDGDGVIGLLDFIHFAARLRDADLLKE